MAKHQRMFETVERWQRSGLSKAAFARRERISISTFHYWCRRFDEHHVETVSPAFVEVPDPIADGDLMRSPAAAEQSVVTPRLSLEFPDGLCVVLY